MENVTTLNILKKLQINNEMKILITGGTGFIGYNIAKKLSHNNKIYLIKRNISKKKKS